jgi:TDG/mug DNA glycosylase family protein
VPTSAPDPDLQPIDDVLPTDGANLRLLICGINPGVASARTNRHYAGPGNRFWPALSASGLVPHPVGPDDQHLLPGWGIGMTNLVARPSARATEVTAAELRAGGERLLAFLAQHRPVVTAVLGVTTFRIAFGQPTAQRGPQPDRPDLWVLDNPSGLNAHTSVTALATALAAAGRAAGLDPAR